MERRSDDRWPGGRRLGDRWPDDQWPGDQRPDDRRGPAALVLRALGLGDLLVAVPALRLLRRALPRHRIVLAAPAALAPLVGTIEAVDEHRSVGSPGDLDGPARPDVAVNLHGRGPASHAALDALGPRRRIGHAAPGWDGPPWTDDPRRSERRRWCDLLAATGLVPADDAAAGADDVRLAPRRGCDGDGDGCGDGGPGTDDARLAPRRGGDECGDNCGDNCGDEGAVVIHPGAAYGAKRWPVERFAAVASALAADGDRVVVTGSDAERGLTAAVAGAVAAGAGAGAGAGRAGAGEDRGGRTRLAALVDLVAAARLVVSGDTGIAHLATALGTPSVVLFGPVGPAQWGPPPGGPHVTLTDASVRRGDRFAETPDPALLAVGVADVLAAARSTRGDRRSVR